MKYSLTIWKEAEPDISDDFNFFAEYRPGSGDDFIFCIDTTLSKIERNPEH